MQETNDCIEFIARHGTLSHHSTSYIPETDRRTGVEGSCTLQRYTELLGSCYTGWRRKEGRKEGGKIRIVVKTKNR